MRRGLIVIGTLGAVACHAVKADLATDARMQIKGAQFVRAAMPDPTDGPPVASVNLVTYSIRPGLTDKALSGALGPTATAAALMLSGDPGYWIVPAGFPNVTTPAFPSYSTVLAFSSDLRSGTYDFTVRAVDEAGRFGPPTITSLVATDNGLPGGALVVALSWNNQADVDLRVITPAGVEIWNREPSSEPAPPPGTLPHDAGVPPGLLDVDSNAGCVPDGRRAEHVVWSVPPPSGHYVVRVDTPSLCDEPAAYWHAEAFLRGASIGGAEGTSTPNDTRFSHDRGAGVLAFEFDVP
jgi:hypothetical protein